MSSQTSFLLAPSTSNLPTAPSLNLLPFSLGPSSSPYTSTSSPLASYFIPRPCPPSHPYITEGTPIAAFRGRQLVGHTAEVPRGYRGIVLGAGKRPDRGGLEERGNRKENEKEKWPLTPASSALSVTGSIEDEGVGARRSPRKSKGAGQVALARPKTRQVARRGEKKRIRLDSDEEDEEESSLSKLARTPSKRVKVERLEDGEGEGSVAEGLPAIIVQAPTPRKPRVEVSVQAILEEEESGQMVKDGEDDQEVVKEDIVPSPATENDPPTFPITPRPVDDQSKSKSDESRHEDEIEGTVRRLRPVSTFESITLWTADAPLAGFRPDELKQRALRDGDVSTGTKTEGAEDAVEPSRESERRVKGGWWRAGGAGEGGDEVIRGMGEYLGLMEMLHEPVYLQGLTDDDDDE